MIHLFRCCEALCSLPRRLCDAACHACWAACAQCQACGCCKCCSCRHLYDVCNGLALVLFQRPLAGYVLLCALFGVPIVAFGTVGLFAPASEKCHGLTTASAGCIVLGVLHFAFAIHFQRQLMSGFHWDEDTGIVNKAQREIDLAARTWHVLLYDVGFCLYVPTFLFSFGLGLWGLASAMYCGSGLHLLATGLLMAHGTCALFYFICCTCVVSCCGMAEWTLGLAASSGVEANTPQYGTHEVGAPVAVAQAVPPAATAPAA
uniref:Uncharacterized protein n=1 Tax=Alexandrium andersonii TaxID=327968 RepID=A0A7S2CII8_9DINO|mmetsp:Transcript_39456/g.89718  ORF Transcript_39456/g.89718 Transcript_39456/m.89718 type:complete len:261 (+) Transcript_39456:20-802(+)